MDDGAYTVSLSLQFYDGCVRCVLITCVDPAGVDVPRVSLSMDQLECHAMAKDTTALGLRFLAMIDGYGATLGWRFEAVPGRRGQITIIPTTLVQVTLGRVS